MTNLNVTAKKPCRLCGRSERELFLHLQNSPANISGMLRPNQFATDAPVDLKILRCKACGFVQLDPMFLETFYDDYVMTVTHSAQMREFQDQQAKDFIDTFDLRSRAVVEVGCGDGNYLECLQRHGAVVTGVEPSGRFRQMAIQRGFTVHGTYVHADTFLPDGPFDAFVTRQVLEHVPDPREFLIGIRNSLRANAVGLVEVPSLEQAMESYRFYDFFPDHVNYFSGRTLRIALESAGFEVDRVFRGMGGEYNVAWVRVSPEFEFNDFQGVLATIVSDLSKWVDEYQSHGRRIAVWGAGGKGISSMAVARLKNIAYVIDSDPFKHGLHTPVCHFPIVAPEHLIKDPVDAIVLTALAYKDEILNTLRGRFGFRGPILVLGKKIELLTC